MKGCLVFIAIVILAVLGLRLIFGTLTLIGGFVGAVLAVVPAWIWAIGAIAILIWAVQSRSDS